MALTTEGLGFIGSNFSNNYVKLRGQGNNIRLFRTQIRREYILY